MKLFKILLGLIILSFCNNSYGQLYKTETEWKNFFRDNQTILEPLEGLYSCTRIITKKNEASKPVTLKPFTCAIFYEGDAFLTKRTDEGDPEIKVYFCKTGNPGKYVMVRYDTNTSMKIQTEVIANNNSLKFTYENPDDNSFIAEEWVKIYP